MASFLLAAHRNRNKLTLIAILSLVSWCCSSIAPLAASFDDSTANSSSSGGNNNTDNTAAAATVSKPHAVKLGVYYESRCPDSRRFFLAQLVPVFKDLDSIIEPLLVPFGHARITGPDSMICQHGASECAGNRLMACVQARASSNQSQVIETLGCLFLNKLSAEECVKRHMASSVTFDDIEKCRTSKESFDMMRKFEETTGRIGYVPKITINDQFSEDIQEECEQDLRSCICKHYGNGPAKPSGCNSNNSKDGSS